MSFILVVGTCVQAYMACALHQLCLVYGLLHVAVMAFQRSANLVYHVENRLHGLVIGDALGVVATNNAF